MDEIINYIMETPGNTNPNVLRGMLQNNNNDENLGMAHCTYNLIINNPSSVDMIAFVQEDCLPTLVNKIENFVCYSLIITENISTQMSFTGLVPPVLLGDEIFGQFTLKYPVGIIVDSKPEYTVNDISVSDLVNIDDFYHQIIDPTQPASCTFTITINSAPK